MGNDIRGTIFDIKKYAIHDGPGIRTTVFFKGCSLDCWWCQNPESRNPGVENFSAHRVNGGQRREETVGRTVTVEETLEEIKKDHIFYDQSGGGVTLSGGEPLMQPEFLTGLLKACKEEKISTALDTSGYGAWQNLENIVHLVDLFLYDLKLMDDEAHIKYTGVSNKIIVENLRLLAKQAKEIRIRVPLIPRITDTKSNLEAIHDFVGGLGMVEKVDHLPFNRFCKEKYTRFGITNRLGAML